MTSKRCEQKTLVGYGELLPGVSVSRGQWVFRDAVRVTRVETWCGDHVSVSGSWPEGDPLPGVVECEKCRKAKAAADVEEPPKA